VSRKYEAAGPEVEFEPGSRGRVLRNLLGVVEFPETSLAAAIKSAYAEARPVRAGKLHISCNESCPAVTMDGDY
jgi:hypothetical protein